MESNVSAFAAYKKLEKSKQKLTKKGHLKGTKPFKKSFPKNKLKRGNKPSKHFDYKNVNGSSQPPNDRVKPSSTEMNSVANDGKKRKMPYQNAEITKENSEQAKKIKTSSSGENRQQSSVEEGLKLLGFIIAPSDPQTFFKDFWERRPFAIQRNNKKYFSKLISFKGIDKALREQHVEFTTNIDITEYKNGVRSTLNPDGRALPGIVWDSYSEGCSIRLLNPQKFFPPIHEMLAKLQEFFHCMVGANVYLTPPNSQGFAPHYDDIEAFVLQIEGQKKWKLYKPISDAETLPRVSSRNFNQEEIGKPIIETVLHAGDVLYFPRGFIHQASTVDNQHSLHITLSCYQKNSFADLLEILVPKMLSRAIEENVELRHGLPLNIWQHFGAVRMGENKEERKNISQVFKDLLQKVFDQNLIDEAVDEMGARFQHDAVPPVITPEEKPLTAFGSKTEVNSSGFVLEKPAIDGKSKVRLLRAHIIRLVAENDVYRIYYYLDNSIDYHEYEANYLEVDEDGKNIIEELLKRYPSYIKVKSLPGTEEQQISVVQEFWDRGLLTLKGENKEK